MRRQDSRRVESADEALAGKVGAWLDRPVFSGGLIACDEGHTRNGTCIMEIWVECLQKDQSSLGQLNSQMIGRVLADGEWETVGRCAVHGRYGNQRIWERGGIVGRLARAAWRPALGTRRCVDGNADSGD